MIDGRPNRPLPFLPKGHSWYQLPTDQTFCCGSQCRFARKEVHWFKGATPQPSHYGAPGMFRWSLVVADPGLVMLVRFGELDNVSGTTSKLRQVMCCRAFCRLGNSWKLMETAEGLSQRSTDETFPSSRADIQQASLLREMLQLQLPDDRDCLRMQRFLSIHRTHDSW